MKYVMPELAEGENMAEKQIEIYKGTAGEIVFNVDKNEQTIWATQAQIAECDEEDAEKVVRF